jgi:septal ring factor EnvC (AmiA/AmiB activator)
LKAKDVWLYVMSAGLVASLIGVAVLAFNLSSLRADLTAANERAEEAENRTAEAEEETEEAEEETEDVLDDLEATEEQLRIVEKSLRNARAASPGPTGDLAEQLANGTAVPIGGLSVSLPGRDGAK